MIIDLGCKTGGALDTYKQCYHLYNLPKPTKCIGYDTKTQYKDIVESRGYEFRSDDVLKMKWEEADVYLLFDFLEHLPSVEDSIQVTKQAIKHAKHAVWIVMPTFENEPQLTNNNLRLTWQHWTGHPSHFKLTHLAECCSDYKVTIHEKNIIKDSKSPFVVPKEAPIDTTVYTKKLGYKPIINFNPPIVGHYSIIIHAQSQEQ